MEGQGVCGGEGERKSGLFLALPRPADPSSHTLPTVPRPYPWSRV